MIRLYRLISPVVLVLASAVAAAQSAGNSAPAPSGPIPHPVHADGPVPMEGTKANPADIASPPLADPLKQQAVTDPPQTLASPAVQFIMQASADGRAEVQMAQLALTRSRAPEVRRFARRVVADHQSLDATLEVLAINKGTSVPNVLDADYAQRRFGSLTGQAFDQAFATQMFAVHGRAIALYGAATSLTERDVADFASRALPMLRAHQAQAGSLVAGVPPRSK